MSKWLVISSHDDRNDFNLEIRTFEGTFEEFEESIHHFGFTKEERKEEKDGVYVYHSKKTQDRYCANINDTAWNEMKKNLEVVYFGTVILIPFENLNKEDFYLVNPLVERNIKFGFLDINKNYIE